MVGWASLPESRHRFSGTTAVIRVDTDTHIVLKLKAEEETTKVPNQPFLAFWMAVWYDMMRFDLCNNVHFSL